MAMSNGPDKSNDHIDGDRPASEGIQEKAIFSCEDCLADNPAIQASHHYSIEYDEEQGKYSRSDGRAYYSCGNCHTELSLQDIEDVLKSVDEL